MRATGQADDTLPMEPARPAGDERRFRPEIEGLRAVAAILVAVYHVFLGRVSGGVDVFFVVAGFLITTTLLGQVRRSGAVMPSLYLSRLASRLIPTAAFVLAVVLVASVVLLPVTRLRPVVNEIAASALYVENWALAIQQVDYLARGEALSPVQHFWALSIQGQFYLVWLAIFGVVGLAVRRLRRDAVPLAVGSIAILFIVSLLFSVVLTADNQPLAYFHTGTRMWEFAAGGLVALAVPRLRALSRLPVPVGITAGWAGLAMILSCGVLLSVSTSFPGWVALWPVIGGLLVILAGDAAGSHSRWSSTRLLASRPFVFLGGVSYAIYLWHWPILVFYRTRAGVESVALVPGLLIIAVAIVLAIATTYLVEQPIRGRVLPRLRAWPIVMLGAATMILVAVSAVGAWRIMPRDVFAAEIGSSDYPGAAAMAPTYAGGAGDVPFAPPVLLAQRDYPAVVKNKCNVGTVPPGDDDDWAGLYSATMRAPKCQFGDPDSDTTVVLVGGSHAAQWLPAMEAIATERGWHLISTTKSGCRFSADPQGEHAEGRSCAAWNAGAIEEIVSLRPDLVLTTGTVSGARGEHVEDGFLEYARILERAGIPVAAFRDVPRWPTSPVDCLGMHADDPDACWVARSRSMAPVDPFQRLPDPPSNVTLIDISDYLCEGDRCPAVIGNVVTNYDSHHLSASFVRTLAPMLEARLPELRGAD